MIFDECHRSQFGDMHKSITKHFKNYHIFGFTGTPIFPSNSNSSNAPNMRTTAQVFGGESDENGNKVRPLHAYTIVDAIHDGNVLPFRIDYINTIKNPEILYDKQVKAIDREKALLDPKRVSEITQYILEHFEQKTYRNQSRSYYDHKVITNVEKMAKSKNNTVSEQKTTAKVNGFNSIFAVASIPAAIAYYNEFKKQMEETGHKLNIATIFSFNPNEEDPDDILQDENFDTSGLDQTSRDFLDSAIDDYNELFNVSYDTSADKFPNYYKEFSCIAGACPDTCCAGWQIVIDDQTLKKYQHFKGPFRNRLHNDIDWKEHVFRQYNRRCAFLNEENLCDIYTEAGPEMFCRTCRNYPRHIEEFEGLREISLSLSCPEAIVAPFWIIRLLRGKLQLPRARVLPSTTP